MNRITFKRLGIAYAIFLGSFYLFGKCCPSISPYCLQVSLILFDIFNFVF